TCPQSLPPGPARSHTDDWRLRNSVRLAGNGSLDCPDAGFPGFLMVADDGGGRSAYCGSRLCSAECWPPHGPGREGRDGGGGGACAGGARGAAAGAGRGSAEGGGGGGRGGAEPAGGQ